MYTDLHTYIMKQRVTNTTTTTLTYLLVVNSTNCALIHAQKSELTIHREYVYL